MPSSFELCFERWPFATNINWVVIFTYYIYLGDLGIFIWAHFEPAFEPFPLEFEVSHTKEHIEIYIYTYNNILYHYKDICVHSEPCFEFLPIWFQFLPIYPTCTLVFYEYLFGLVLSLNLGLTHWNSNYPMQNKILNIFIYSFLDLIYQYLNI